MGLFGRKPTPCPLCQEDLGKDGPRLGHWNTHVHLIESGEGSGNYTWRCICGPSEMYWEKDFQAAAGLSKHMHDRHAVRMI